MKAHKKKEHLEIRYEICYACSYNQLPGGGPVHDADDAPAYNKSNTLIKNQIKHFIFVTGTRESF